MAMNQMTERREAQTSDPWADHCITCVSFGRGNPFWGVMIGMWKWQKRSKCQLEEFPFYGEAWKYLACSGTRSFSLCRHHTAEFLQSNILRLR